MSQLTIVALFVLLQIALFLWMINYAASFWQWNLIFISLSAVTVFILITKDDNPAYKLLWIIPILSFPVFGGAFYLFYRQRNFSKKQIKRHFKIEQAREGYVKEITPSLDTRESNYLKKQNWLSYQNTKTKFLNSGEMMFEELLFDIKESKDFIFISYFIIKQGYMWDTILELLGKKTQEGVEVIIIYDDFGSADLSHRYPKYLKEKYNILAYKFNPLRLRINFSNNYRSHQKAIVIDGRVGYVTGNNIGDEYINLQKRFGHWNDAGIRLEGEAVWSLTLGFLSTLEFLTKTKVDYDRYYSKYSASNDGHVIPFFDTPLDKEPTTKTLYLSLINKAKKSIQITTPYLIIDYEFKNALRYAAQSGIDVEIIIPKIPDKKLVYMVTESHTPLLINSGVKIYRYTPGFIHSKIMIIDGKEAIIGTANLDYRSLYLHFENSIYLKDSNSVLDMELYFDETRRVSKLIDVNEKRSIPYRFLQVFFKMFSGLL